MTEQPITEQPIAEKSKVKIPKFSIVFFGLALLSVILYAIASNNAEFADFFNFNISTIIRGALATISNIIPLSIAELIIICSPIILFLLIKFCCKKFAKSWHDVGIFCLTMLSIVCLLYSVFVFAFGIGYHTPSIDKKLGLDKKEVSAKELADTAVWLAELTNAELDNVEFKDKSSSVMPYSIREMNNKLLAAYDSLRSKYGFLPKLTSYVKPIMLSEPMTYTHISGVYTFFTGEANINTNAPDYSLPFTAAHELAHQRGIAREDEANFVAFLVCIESDDPYLRYCGYLNLCEYVLNSLYSANADMWEESYKKLDNRTIYEMIAYNEHYEKYRDNVVGDISGAINDAYLQANGTQGTASYGLVVDLAVAYFHQNTQN